jgi:hypothetical protein
VSSYVLAMCVLTLVAVALAKETAGSSLHDEAPEGSLAPAAR